MELKHNKLFQFHPRCRKVGLTHICFADDLLLFTKGNTASIQLVRLILDKFAAVSGLKANPAKSCIYFGGVQQEEKMNILQSTGMTEGQFPFRYLGVLLSSKKLNISQYQPLIQTILQRVNCWASKLLSYAGRLQLIQSLLFSVQIYWSQVFVLP